MAGMKGMPDLETMSTIIENKMCALCPAMVTCGKAEAGRWRKVIDSITGSTKLAEAHERYLAESKTKGEFSPSWN